MSDFGTSSGNPGAFPARRAGNRAFRSNSSDLPIANPAGFPLQSLALRPGQGGVMESWDLYDHTRNRVNARHVRGNKLASGLYHIVVHVWIVNSRGELLLTQRHPDKTFPYKWEGSGGSVLAGEGSFDGALREVKEEIGIDLRGKEGKLLKTIKRDNDFCSDFLDVWLFKADFTTEEAKLQETEVVGIQWVSESVLRQMFARDEMSGSVRYLPDFIDQGLLL
jgi:8-oxo-dGTP pyrophosphatase MutT (NUDIX family)